jgi:hypothetical protein
MPILSWIERRTGHELGSASVVADSKQTLLCTYLSAILLAGLVLNSLLGWSWADPVAAVVIAGFAVREGIEAWVSCVAPTRRLCEAGTASGPDGGEVGCVDDCCRPAVQHEDQPNARPEAVLEQVRSVDALPIASRLSMVGCESAFILYAGGLAGARDRPVSTATNTALYTIGAGRAGGPYHGTQAREDRF